jgi:hypothetical protein
MNGPDCGRPVSHWLESRGTFALVLFFSYLTAVIFVFTLPAPTPIEETLLAS